MARARNAAHALVEQRDEELADVAGMSQELVDAGVDVYLNVNNHFEGCAPLTIERIEELLGHARERPDGAGQLPLLE